MPRIRTIKPDFWSSEDVAAVPRDARLMFIGMWNFADDSGNGPASPKSLKIKIFPGDDDINVQDIDHLLGLLADQDLIKIYSVDGKQFYHITGWHHQRINRPQPPIYPPFTEHSVIDHGPLTEHSLRKEGRIGRKDRKDREGEKTVGRKEGRKEGQMEGHKKM